MASQLRVDKILPVDGAPTGGAGGVVQVQSTTKTGAFQKATGDTFQDVTGLSVSITPKFSTSKILVLYDMSWSTSNGHMSCRLMRDSTPIKIGDAADSRTQATGQQHYSSNGQNQYDTFQVAGTHMDSPATTSAVTYKMQVGTPYSASYDCRVNYQGDDSNQAWVGRTASSITVMEVSG